MKYTSHQRGNIAATVIAVVVVAAIIILVILATNKGSDDERMMDEATDIMHEGESMMEQGEAMMDEAEKMMDDMEYAGDVLAGTTTPLIAFTNEDFQTAQAEGKYIMLYFYANWCPNCKTELREALTPAFNELDIENVVGFLVNYNDLRTDAYERDLARKHGIGYQHSRVFLAPDGGVIEKTAPVTWTKAEYLEYIPNLVN